MLKILSRLPQRRSFSTVMTGFFFKFHGLLNSVTRLPAKEIYKVDLKPLSVRQPPSRWQWQHDDCFCTAWLPLRLGFSPNSTDLFKLCIANDFCTVYESQSNDPNHFVLATFPAGHIFDPQSWHPSNLQAFIFLNALDWMGGLDQQEKRSDLSVVSCIFVCYRHLTCCTNLLGLEVVTVIDTYRTVNGSCNCCLVVNKVGLCASLYLLLILHWRYNTKAFGASLFTVAPGATTQPVLAIGGFSTVLWNQLNANHAGTFISPRP